MSDWIFEHLWQTWLVAAIVLGVVEMISLDLVFLMLAIGCGLAMATALLGFPVLAQTLVALVSSVALLVVLRPGLVSRLHRGEELRTGAEALIGRSARSLTTIEAGTPGRVKIGGDEWTAVPYDESHNIPAGQTVEVVEIRGATAVVRPSPHTLSIDPKES